MSGRKALGELSAASVEARGGPVQPHSQDNTKTSSNIPAKPRTQAEMRAKLAQWKASKPSTRLKAKSNVDLEPRRSPRLAKKSASATQRASGSKSRASKALKMDDQVENLVENASVASHQNPLSPATTVGRKRKSDSTHKEPESATVKAARVSHSSPLSSSSSRLSSSSSSSHSSPIQDGNISATNSDGSSDLTPSVMDLSSATAREMVKVEEKGVMTNQSPVTTNEESNTLWELRQANAVLTEQLEESETARAALVKIMEGTKEELDTAKKHIATLENTVVELSLLHRVASSALDQNSSLWASRVRSAASTMPVEQESELKSAKASLAKAQMEAKKAREEASALRFGNEVLLQEMSQQRKRSRRAAAAANAAAEEELSGYRHTLTRTVATLRQEMAGGLQAATEKLAATQAELDSLKSAQAEQQSELQHYTHMDSPMPGSGLPPPTPAQQQQQQHVQLEPQPQEEDDPHPPTPTIAAVAAGLSRSSSSSSSSASSRSSRSSRSSSSSGEEEEEAEADEMMGLEAGGDDMELEEDDPAMTRVMVEAPVEPDFTPASSPSLARAHQHHHRQREASVFVPGSGSLRNPATTAPSVGQGEVIDEEPESHSQN